MGEICVFFFILILFLFSGKTVLAGPRTVRPEAFANLERNCARYPEAAALRKKFVAEPDARLLEAADEWLIDFVPDPEVKRSLFVHEGNVIHGCPVHRGGRYIFTPSADPFVPYTLTCPIGGETYPNEAFPESGTPASPRGEQGWLDTRKTVDGKPNPTCGLKYYFHAHYAYWGRWVKLGPFMKDLAVAHLLAEEGDPRKARAARAASVLLLRLAHVFPHLKREDFASYDNVGLEFPHHVKITDYVFEPSHTDCYAVTYDLIRDAILADESLLRLDYGRTGKPWGDDPDHDYDGDGKVTTADLLACIEQDLLRDYGSMYMAIPPRYANATMVHLQTLSLLAVVLDERDYYEYARSALDRIATNWFTNDGAYYEGAIPGYGEMGVKALRNTFARLRRFDPDLLSPRVVKGLLFAPSVVCLDAVLPNTDDAGGQPLPKLGKQLNLSVGDYQQAYLEYGDPRLLQTVVLMGGDSAEPKFQDFEGLWTDYSDEKVAAIQDALKAFSQTRSPSTVTRAGYAVLRGEDRAAPCDLFITFDGFGGSHTHFDTFNPILYGFGYPLVPDIGYPDNLKSPTRSDWVNHTLSHWTVTVDRQPIDGDFERSRLKLFVDRPGFKVFSGSSPRSYKDLASVYERTLCLIDKPDGVPLIVDFFRVRGGREHLYSFHGAAEDGARSVVVEGATLEAPSSFETLQGMWYGRHVPYAEPIEGSTDRCLAYVTNVRSVRVDKDTQTLKVSLPRGDGEGTQLDFWMPAACAGEFVVGEGPTAPSIPQKNVQLPFLIARSGRVDGDAEIDSTFCAVVEPHQGGAGVANVRFDPAEGRVQIDFRDGSGWALEAGGEAVRFQAQGSDGATVREVTAHLYPVGAVGAVDRASRTLALGASVGEGDLLIFENDLGRNTFYRVDAVLQDGRVRVGDRWTDLRVARGYLTGEQEGSRLFCDGDDIIQAPIQAQCRGARIVNEAGREVRVVQFENEAIVLDAPPEACAAFAVDADNDGKMAFDIYDFGEGDMVCRIDTVDSLEG